ncbi:hypothetical protein GCM10009767_27830 [Kocuria aegyptia]|uniref:Uncharacterized protein n=1 Tax=Kocuria aegyptia TaxID=330943 RepID=A0ABN2KXM3_9MICC
MPAGRSRPGGGPASCGGSWTRALFLLVTKRAVSTAGGPVHQSSRPVRAFPRARKLDGRTRREAPHSQENL